MSVLEDILGKVVTGALGGSEGSDKEKVIKALVPVLITLLANGGLAKILEKMKGQGLGDEAASWVGTGENKAISGDQAAELIGADQVKRIAGEVGLPEDRTANLIAEALPQLVDQASPDGNEPDEAKVDEVLKA